MTASEGWLSMSAAARYVGPRRGGRPTHPLTIHEWWHNGLRGIRLRSEWRGGLRCTRAEWVEEFFAAVAAERERSRRERQERLPPPPASAKRRNEACKKRLAKRGLI